MRLRDIIDRIKLPFRQEKELFSSLYEVMGFYPQDISYYKQALMHKSIGRRNEKGIAKELQTFVVQWFPLVITASYTLVHQRLLVVADVMRIETDDVVKGRKKLLLLAERELYAFNDITKPHTS